jgi:hypothetical protein
VVPAELKAELQQYYADNWAAMSLEQQASKLRSLAASHNLAESAVADSVSVTAAAVACKISDQMLRNANDANQFQQLFAVLDTTKQLLAQTVRERSDGCARLRALRWSDSFSYVCVQLGMQDAPLEANTRYPISKATELLKRFLHWANSTLMPLAERETRIIQLQVPEHWCQLRTQCFTHLHFAVIDDVSASAWLEH